MSASAINYWRNVANDGRGSAMTKCLHDACDTIEKLERALSEARAEGFKAGIAAAKGVLGAGSDDQQQAALDAAALRISAIGEKEGT